jgi:outer membrane protein, heavy metal efflux system
MQQRVRSFQSLMPVLAGGILATLAQAGPPPLAREFPAYAPPSEPGSAPESAAAGPKGELTLPQALALILARNPNLAAAAWEIRIRESGMAQAGLGLNPELSFDLEDFAGSGNHTGVGASQATLQLGQEFELGGKRKARRKTSDRARERSLWEYEAQRLETVRAASQAYVEVVSAQRAVGRAATAVGLADKMADAVAMRAKAGRASVVEQNRTQVATAGARIEQEWAKHRLEEAREALAALWGESEPGFDSAHDVLDSLIALPGLDRLAACLPEHPELAGLDAEMARAAALAEQESANRIPNLIVKGGVRHLAATEDVALVAGMSLPLPLSNRNQGRILEARQQKAQAAERKRAAAIALRGRLAEAYKVAATAVLELDLLRKSVVPGAEAAFSNTQIGYQQGRYGHFEVLDAQKNLNAAHLQYLRALTDFHRAVAALESLIGRPLASLSPATERNP